MGRAISKNWLRLILIFITAFAITLVGGVIIKTFIHHNTSSEAETSTENTQNSPDANEEPDSTPIIPEFIDLQPTVDAWLATAPGNVGLMIYDLDNSQVAATYNADRVFNTASIYKLFFVYDGYRQIELELENTDDYFTTANDAFHSGPLTLGNCLDLMIRESYNTCADPMRSDTNRFTRAEALAAELNLQNTSSAGLYSSAADLTELMKLYWQHPDLSSEAWDAIQDSMLNQPATTYNWRQGLPSGFDVAEVYDKVGWNYTGNYWSIYNDATFIVFPEQNHHYIMVVLTENFPTYNPITNLGSMIEDAILNHSEADTASRIDQE